MRWSTVKNLMLGLLISMNIFMIGASVLKRVNSERIPPLVAAAAVDALNNNGIDCDPSLLPDRYLTVRTFSGEFPTAIKLSRMFFGEELAFQTEGRTLIARQNGAELRAEDTRFTFTGPGEPVNADEKALRRAMKNLGLDMSRAEYAGNGEFVFVWDGKPVFGMYLHASLSEDGSAAFVEASWPDVSFADRRRAGISIIDHIPEMLELFPGGGRIEALEAGYTPVRDDNTETYSFEPAWRVTMDDGRSEIIS